MEGKNSMKTTQPLGVEKIPARSLKNTQNTRTHTRPYDYPIHTKPCPSQNMHTTPTRIIHHGPSIPMQYCALSTMHCETTLRIVCTRSPRGGLKRQDTKVLEVGTALPPLSDSAESLLERIIEGESEKMF